MNTVLNWIHDHLVAIVILLPLGLVALLNIGWYLMNSDGTWPPTNVSQEEIEASIADDPNVEKSEE